MSIHPKRRHIHEPGSVGAKIADAVAAGMGSWKFVIIQTIIVVVWITGNVWLLTHPFDPYPLILLNLIFSTQAAYASPLILMSQNRQAEKDRKRDDLEASEVDMLLTLTKQSHEILQFLHEGNIIERLDRQDQQLDAQDQQIEQILKSIEARKQQKKVVV